MSAGSGTGPHQSLNLNVGGEGEDPNCINQQPPWVDLGWTISRNGQPLSTLTQAGIPLLFCDNTCLPFPDATVDHVITNGVPIDKGINWLGPTVDSREIKRVLKPGGTWHDNGVPVYRKP